MASPEEGARFKFVARADQRMVELFQMPDAGFQAAENINHTLRFINDNCPRMNSFMDRFYGNPLPSLGGMKITAPVFKLVKQEMMVDRRKVTGDFYMKHLLMTAYLADDLTKHSDYTDPEKNLMISAALMHDFIKMRKSRKFTSKFDSKDLADLLDGITDINGNVIMQNWNPAEKQKLVVLVSLLTRPKKDREISFESWRRIKRTEFNGLINLTGDDISMREEAIYGQEKLQIKSDEADKMARIIRDIKVAELLANLRETADDIEWRRVTSDSDTGMRPLHERFAVFVERIDAIETYAMSVKNRWRARRDLAILAKKIVEKEAT